MANARTVPPVPAWTRHGDHFEFRWPALDIAIIANHIREDTETITAELAFQSTVGENSHLHFARLNLLSTRARNELVKPLTARARDVPWPDVLEQAAAILVREWRTPPGTIDLLSLPIPTAKEVFLDDHAIALHGEPTADYGAGDNAKSLLTMGYALAVAAGVPFANVVPWVRGPVLWLDFEDRAWVAALRLRAWMAGLGIEGHPPFLYRDMTGYSLPDVASDLRKSIRDDGVVLVVIDSYIMAAGADPEKADTARRFHMALRDLEVATKIISHTTKAEAHDRDASAYGSVVFTNQCRNTWLLIKGNNLASESPSQAQFIVQAMHKKHNHLGRSPDMALKVTMDLTDRLPTKIQVAWAAEIAKEDPELAARTQGLAQRILSLLAAEGSTTALEIATNLNSDLDRTRAALNHLLEIHLVSRMEGIVDGKREVRWSVPA